MEPRSVEIRLNLTRLIRSTGRGSGEAVVVQNTCSGSVISDGALATHSWMSSAIVLLPIHSGDGPEQSAPSSAHLNLCLAVLLAANGGGAIGVGWVLLVARVAAAGAAARVARLVGVLLRHVRGFLVLRSHAPAVHAWKNWVPK